MSGDDGLLAVQGLLHRGRLSIDESVGGRTCFFSHVGAMGRLVPGPWIAHRDLILTLALANLAPSQRSSLARALRVEWDHEFGVGRAVLRATPSGLPLGGSNLRLQARTGGPSCQYVWALGPSAKGVPVDWIALRVQPEWALDEAPRAMSPRGLTTLVGLGGTVLVLVPSAVAARQVADLVGRRVPVAAHPRYAPHLRHADDPAVSGERSMDLVEGGILLWPHDALDSPALRRVDPIHTAVLVSGPEPVRRAAEAWAMERKGLELLVRACPGRVDRDGLARFWEASGRPRMLLRGDPGWSSAAQQWLSDLGAHVQAKNESTQLGLF